MKKDLISNDIQLDSAGKLIHLLGLKAFELLPILTDYAN